MVYQVPNFLMGQAANVDFSPVQNALAQWNKNRQFNAKLEQDQAQFQATNALARAHLGIAQRSADRADQMTPLQMDLLRAQVQEAQAGLGTAPLRRDLLGAQAELARAQAKAAGTKDAFQELILRGFGGGSNALAPQPQPAPQPGPTFQPQSFDSGVTATDPMLIPTQASPTPSQAPQAQPDLVDIPGIGRMPRERARALGMAAAAAGKGDLGKLIMDEVDKDKLAKEARTEVDKKEERATDSLLRLRNIRSSFDPDLLTYGTQAKMRIAEIQAKAGKLDKATEEKLYKFATFRRDAAAHFNAVLKDNSGATVTEQEMKRNGVELPNAGSGMFDGDDPVTFQAKLDRGEEIIALGIARTRHLRQNGFTGSLDAAAKQMPIERMRDLINQRAKQIESELRQANPGMPQPIIDRQRNLKIKQEFGI